MAGRLAWILAGGAAIVAGMAFQGNVFDEIGDEPRVVVRSGDSKSLSNEKVDGLVERIVEEKIAEAQVIDKDGEPVEVDSAVMKQLAAAATELVKAEAALAILTIGKEPSEEARKVAERRIEAAQTRVDALGKQIETAGDRQGIQRDTQRERIRNEIREEVRSAMRDG